MKKIIEKFMNIYNNKMYRNIAMVLVIILVIIIVNVINNNKNKKIIYNEVSQRINERILEVYKTDNAIKYGIKNIRFNIYDIRREKNEYTFKIVIDCDANDDLDNIQKSLVAFEIEKIVDDFGKTWLDANVFQTSNGLKVTLRNEKNHNEMITSRVNGEAIHIYDEQKIKNDLEKQKQENSREKDAYICASDVVEKELSRFSNIKVCSYKDCTISYNSSTKIYIIKGKVSYTNAYNAKTNAAFTVNLKLTSTGYSDSSCLIY